MIHTKYLISSILLFSTLCLSAIDMNDTVEIIEEASKDTESLQKDFSQLIDNNNIEPIQLENISVVTDKNVTAQEVIIVEDKYSIDTKEHNQTIKKITEDIVTKENNKTIQEANITKNIPQEPKIIVTQESNKTLQNTNEEEDGSFKKGMVIFKTKLKVVCKMTGEDFAKNYTQEDWDDIYDNNEFEKTVYKLCPTIKGKYDEKWTNDLYQFSIKYASDSDEIPEC